MTRAARTVRRSITITVAVAGVSAGLGGCINNPQPHDDPPSTSASAPSTSRTPSPTLDPRAAAALEAFRKFSTATFNADRRPLPKGKAYPAKADFTLYSWDPLRAQVLASLIAAERFGIAYRGTPPTPRITAVDVRLDADPYPTVVLTNCDTPAPTWEAYDPATGKALPTTGSAVPPPYEAKVTLILFKGRWGAQSITADKSRTCTG